MKFFPGKKYRFFPYLSAKQGSGFASGEYSQLRTDNCYKQNRCQSNLYVTFAIIVNDTRFSVLAATFLSANVEAHSNTSHVTLAAVSKDLENAAIEKRKKRASSPREIRISGCIVDRIVLRNIFASSAKFFFLFFLYQRPVPKTLSFDLSLSLSLFFPTEKKKMDVVWRQKRRTSGKKEKERNRSSGAIKLERPFMVGNLLKNRSPAPLSPALVDVGACYTCFERNAQQRRAFEEE